MKLKLALTTLILALALPAFADNDKDDCDRHDRHEQNCHKHDNKHNHCRTNIVNVTVTRTNIVTLNQTNVVNLTNRVVVTTFQTNVVTQVVSLTNVVTVTETNVVTSSLVNLPTADYPLVANHTYTLYVTSDTASRWVRWGKLKSTDTEVARLILPLDLVKNVYWQLVDTTPGYPKTGVVPVETDNEFHNSYLALVKGKVYKVPTTLP